ncbi:threonine synthase [candidate division CSSED10-310 bacterium]|uniref:Threonine synthase n=1 Tax=candidate division CSSED10-310 bacterium TaxID=2855610 RepID=A0ABV6Z6U9_UNCC1
MLQCFECEKQFTLSEKRWRCSCGGLLDVVFDCHFPLEKIKKRKPTLWRYREAIPLQNEENRVSFEEGFTPLREYDFNGFPVLIKHDHLFHTGSFKDRGASVLISKIKELGITRVVEDSSGNAACAIAAYCARAEIGCQIFVPNNTAAHKVRQIAQYGAMLIRVPGTREDTASAALQAAEKDFYASHSWNPFFLQGTKTFAYEVCEQLGWKAPDAVVLPAGNGTLLLGAFLGFNDVYQAHLVAKIPKLIAVQAQNCAPLYKAFTAQMSEIPRIIQKQTVAAGIAIADPVRGKQIIQAVQKTQGHFITVSESEIKKSLLEMDKRGLSIEPTAAATVAGISQYVSRAPSREVIVSVFTGRGIG